jgi:hypothetical protein
MTEAVTVSVLLQAVGLTVTDEEVSVCKAKESKTRVVYFKNAWQTIVTYLYACQSPCLLRKLAAIS